MPQGRTPHGGAGWPVVSLGMSSHIKDSAAKQSAVNARISAAIDAVVADIKSLNDKIVSLQNTPDQVTPEDQAILDEIEASGAILAEKAEALDALTPAA